MIVQLTLIEAAPRPHPALLVIARQVEARERARCLAEFPIGSGAWRLRLDHRGQVELHGEGFLLAVTSPPAGRIPHALDAVGWTLRTARTWWLLRRTTRCWGCGREGIRCLACERAWREEERQVVAELGLPPVVFGSEA